MSEGETNALTVGMEVNNKKNQLRVRLALNLTSSAQG